MRTFKFVPSEAQGPDKKFEGYIELKLLSYEEKLALIEEFGYFDESEEKRDIKRNIRMMISMLKVAKNYYVQVNLKNLETGFQYSSYDDLSYDSSCQQVLRDVATAIAEGQKPGNG